MGGAGPQGLSPLSASLSKPECSRRGPGRDQLLETQCGIGNQPSDEPPTGLPLPSKARGAAGQKSHLPARLGSEANQ